MLNLWVTYCSPKLGTLTTTIKSLQMKLQKREHCSSIFNKNTHQNRLWKTVLFNIAMKFINLPSGNLTVCYWKWPSRNSGFPINKMWFSIVFCMFTSGYWNFPSMVPQYGFPQVTLAEIEHSYGDTSKNTPKKNISQMLQKKYGDIFLHPNYSYIIVCDHNHSIKNSYIRAIWSILIYMSNNLRLIYINHINSTEPPHLQGLGALPRGRPLQHHLGEAPRCRKASPGGMKQRWKLGKMDQETALKRHDFNAFHIISPLDMDRNDGIWMEFDDQT